MGFPINPDGTIDYDNPAPSPTRLTDGAAGYGEPSEAAMEFVLSRLEVNQDELNGEPFWFTSINGTCLTVRTMKAPCDLAWRVLRQEVTALCEEYAAQQAAAAVKARDAEIIAALEARKVPPEKEDDFTVFFNIGIEESIEIIQEL